MGFYALLLTNSNLMQGPLIRGPVPINVLHRIHFYRLLTFTKINDRQFLRDEGREAQNIIKVYLANMCLKGVDTDALVTAYELVVINPFSESAGTVGTRSAVSAEQAGCLPMDEVFRLAVTSFKVYDWRLFGAAS